MYRCFDSKNPHALLAQYGAKGRLRSVREDQSECLRSPFVFAVERVHRSEYFVLHQLRRGNMARLVITCTSGYRTGHRWERLVTQMKAVTRLSDEDYKCYSPFLKNPDKLVVSAIKTVTILASWLIYFISPIQAQTHFPGAAAITPPLVAPKPQHGAPDGYVGDPSCQTCHADNVSSYHETAHYLTSMTPSRETILGKFTPDQSILKTANPKLYFQMDDHADGKVEGFFQTAVAGTPPVTHARTERIGIVVGSGEKGETYLYWSDDQLFQLPVSWWRKMGWVNSPGYRDGFADFDRPIIPRCLECHATYFQSLQPPANRYSTVETSLGIQCEKCHGPGAEHVGREKSKSTPVASAGILNPARFTRERQMDLCAWCHAGHGQSLQPTFSYRPGEPLDKYIEFPPHDPAAPLDVHGNQVELLKQSRCYRSSNMTCLTCHDVHTAQYDAVEFSKRCLICHKPDSATFARADHPLTKNCINCHMPRQETNLIVFNAKGISVRPEITNHWIKTYPAGEHAASTQ